jgi:hypothetical protein
VVLLSCAAAWSQPDAASRSALSNLPAPYAVVFKTTVAHTLADGTAITRVSGDAQARDSGGRWMTSQTGNSMADGKPGITFGNVDDPVAGARISWNSRTHEAIAMQFSSGDERQGCWRSGDGYEGVDYGPVRSRTTGAAGSAGGHPMPPMLPASLPGVQSVKQTTEDLGTASIMGVQVHGTRTTWTTPGGAAGNDQSLVNYNETWIAPILGIALRQVSVNPLNGATTREAVSLDLSEPDMATFQPPDGYTVVTEVLHQAACQQLPQ